MLFISLVKKTESGLKSSAFKRREDNKVQKMQTSTLPHSSYHATGKLDIFKCNVSHNRPLHAVYCTYIVTILFFSTLLKSNLCNNALFNSVHEGGTWDVIST